MTQGPHGPGTHQQVAPGKRRTRTTCGWRPTHLVSAVGDIQACVELVAVEGSDLNLVADISGKPTPCSKDCHSQGTHYWSNAARIPHCVLVTPAHLAVQYGNVGVLQVLLGLPDVNPNSRATGTLDTPLTLAIAHNMVDIVKVLLGNAKVDPNLGKSYETVHEIVKESDYCDFSMTPLSISAFRGQETIARLLLADERVDVNHRGGQALHAAIRGAKMTMVKLLLSDPRINPNIEGPHRGRETITKYPSRSSNYHAGPNNICTTSTEEQCYVYHCAYPLFQAIGADACTGEESRDPEILRALLSTLQSTSVL